MANIVAENEMFFNRFEPILKNRYKMYIDGIPAYIVRAAGMPKLTQEAKTIAHINTEFYVKGKSRWGAINVTLYQPVVPSAAQAVMEWVRLSHESVTGRDGYADFYKKDIIFNQLGPIGDKVSEWILKGAFITQADFGEMSFTDDEPAEITITIQPDYCVNSY